MTRSKDTEMQDILKNIRQKEEDNRTRELRNENATAREAYRASELDKLKEALIYRHDDKGNPVSAWDECLSQAKRATTDAAAGYNSEWKISMANLMAMLVVFNRAVNGSLDMNLRQPIKQILVDKGILGLKDWISIRTPSTISLPSLEHNVTFTDDNKLKIAPLMRSDLVDNKDLLAVERTQLEDAFKAGVTRWLKDNGYKPHPTEEDQFVHETTGALLDKAAFNDLKTDSVNGLQNFLSETTDLSFTPGR